MYQKVPKSQSLSFDGMKGIQKNLGVRVSHDGNDVSFNLFVIPAVPWFTIDDRLGKCSSKKCFHVREILPMIIGGVFDGFKGFTSFSLF